MNYERNANQNYNEVSLHTGQNGHHQSLRTINTGEGVEKREPSHTVGGNVNWCSHYGKQYAAAAAAKSLQSCLTLCDPRDSSPPGSPVPGILQAQTP